jgi:hypothetical protein
VKPRIVGELADVTAVAADDKKLVAIDGLATTRGQQHEED